MELGDGLRFDPGAYELTRDGEPVELEPHAADVLAYLVDHRDRLVSKEELLDEVWGDRFVSESTLTTRIKQVRRALGDDGATQRMIRNVRGRGYQYVGPFGVSDTASGRDVGRTARSSEDAGSSFSGPGASIPRRRAAVLGREAEHERLAGLLVEQRLVTLLGIGGVGKTTLATWVLDAVGDHFRGGIWFVDLVPVGEGEARLVRAIADAVGITTSLDHPIDQVAAVLDRDGALLVLDNCEHVVDDVASVVDRLLDSTSRVHLLLTSREPVGLSDEHRLPLPPLPVIADGGPAVDLMYSCAQRLGVELGDDDRAAVASICRRVDGLPLAIEIAAAQLRHLSVAELAARLDRRFGELTGLHDDRHASLGAVLGDTWDTLSEVQRVALAQLAAFPGPFSLDDVLGVIELPEAECLDVLAQLVDRSLVVRSTDRRRYRIFETVRAFALDAFAEVEATTDPRDRLAAWCLEHVGTDVAEHCLDSVAAAWWRDHADVVRAVEAHLGADRSDDLAMLLSSGALAMHLDDGSLAAETLARIEAHLPSVGPTELRARLHIAGAMSAMGARVPASLGHHAEAAVAAAADVGAPTLSAIALVMRSWALVASDPAAALAAATQAETIADEVGDTRTGDLARSYRMWHTGASGLHEAARESALRLCEGQAVGERYEVDCAVAGAAAFWALDDPVEARRQFDRMPDDSLIHRMWGNRIVDATIDAALGDAASVAAILFPLHAQLVRSGQTSMPDALVPLAALARALGDEERAGRYIEAVRRSPRPTQSLQVTCVYKRLREQLGRRTPTDVSAQIDPVGQEALDWLRGLAADAELPVG